MINAIILLNDDLDNVVENASAKNVHRSSSNLFFLLSVSIPRPLFPSKINTLRACSCWVAFDLSSDKTTCRRKASIECISNRQVRP